MHFLKNCPYCEQQNQIKVADWERVLCPHCKGVFYAEVYTELNITKLSNNGKDCAHTREG